MSVITVSNNLHARAGDMTQWLKYQLLFQRAWVQSQAPTRQVTTVCNSGPRRYHHLLLASTETRLETGVQK